MEPYYSYLRNYPRTNTTDMEDTLFVSNQSWHRTLIAAPVLSRIKRYTVLPGPITFGLILIHECLCSIRVEKKPRTNDSFIEDGQNLFPFGCILQIQPYRISALPTPA